MTTLTPEQCTQPPLCICTTTDNLPTGTNPITTMGPGEGEGGTNASGSARGSMASLAVGLGILSAILAILLVGVVLGWVWSCYTRRGKSGTHKR